MTILTDRTEEANGFKDMVARGRVADIGDVSLSSTQSTYEESDPVAATSTRYRGHRIYNYRRGDRRFRVLETWEAPVIPRPYSGGEKYFEVTRGHRARLDLIALRALGNKYDWWWIAFVNFIQNDEVSSGMTLRVPRPPYQQPFGQRF